MVLFSVCLNLPGWLFSQEHNLTKFWETDTLLKVPESVLLDAGNKILYASNIDGTDPWAKDGRGSIAKVGLDGKIINPEWVKGLHAPKGMGLYKNMLYVADVDRVVLIDVTKGIIGQIIQVEGAGGLNDISINKDGVVYVSDSKNKKLYRIENGVPSVFIENLKGPNGVLAHQQNLYILDNGGAYKVNPDKTLSMITDGMEGGTDGIENVLGNDFIVSCWSGVIYYLKADGTKEKLLDTREQKINSADIAYDAVNRIVYVPTFWKNNIVAYKLR
jgi:hypothetical protein